MERSEAEDIAEALISFKTKWTNDIRAKWTAGTLQLPSSHLSFRGAPPWTHILKRRSVAHRAQARPAHTSQEGDDKHEEKKDDSGNTIDAALHHALRCPKCGSWRDTSRKKSLRTEKGWAHISCPTCKLQSRACGWKCICDKLWYRCKDHSDLDERRLTHAVPSTKVQMQSLHQKEKRPMPKQL